MSGKSTISRKRAARRLELQRRRVLFFAFFGALSVVGVLFLNYSYGNFPALGKFLSPHLGIWQNTLLSYKTKKEDFIFVADTLKAHKVYIDHKGVAHIFAQNEADAYFLQGYMTARDRLWQMDFNTYLASGRSAEIMGVRALDWDRFIRKMGLVQMARKMAELIAQDPGVKNICDAYTRGVNAYIRSLHYAQYPMEYKLYSYKPELWSNYKTALLFKLFTYNWNSGEQDIFRTNFIKTFGQGGYDGAFPKMTSIDMPAFSPALNATPPYPFAAPASVPPYYEQVPRILPKKPFPEPDDLKGSSMWVLAPDKTQEKVSVLGLTMRQSLSLPAVWYQNEIAYGAVQAYGLSYPGIPGILIGLNNYVAWGINSTQIDVKDYLYVKFSDDSRHHYLYAGKIKETRRQVETYKVKGALDRKDTLYFTDMGVLFWDRHNTSNLHADEGYVMRWKALASSDDLKGFLLMNRATNFIEFQNGLSYIASPLLYVAYADIYGHQFLSLQGSVPVRTEGQGDFLADGTSGAYTWNKVIDRLALPYVLDGSNGFAAVSGGHLFYKGEYPHYLNGTFDLHKSYRLYQQLRRPLFSDKEIQAVLQDNYSVFAERITPYLAAVLEKMTLTPDQRALVKILQDWRYAFGHQEAGATIFYFLLQALLKEIWADDLKLLNQPYAPYPPLSVLLQWVQYPDLRADNFIDNRDTKSKKETLEDLVMKAWERVASDLLRLQRRQKLIWGAFNQPVLRHLSAAPALSSKMRTGVAGLPLTADGLVRISESLGTSLQWLVKMKKRPQAYIRILGGQSANVCGAEWRRQLGTDTALTPVYFWMNEAGIDPKAVRQTLIFQNHKKESIWRLFF